MVSLCHTDSMTTCLWSMTKSQRLQIRNGEGCKVKIDKETLCFTYNILALFNCILAVLGMELRTSHMPGKRPTPALFFFFFNLFCWCNIIIHNSGIHYAILYIHTPALFNMHVTTTPSYTSNFKLCVSSEVPRYNMKFQTEAEDKILKLSRTSSTTREPSHLFQEYKMWR